MEHVFEMLLRGVVVQYLGVYTRYIFFRLIGKKKSVAYLSGNTKSSNLSGGSQDLFNVIVGIGIFFIMAISIAYLVFS